jgi:hypothetical protein
MRANAFKLPVPGFGRLGSFLAVQTQVAGPAACRQKIAAHSAGFRVSRDALQLFPIADIRSGQVWRNRPADFGHKQQFKEKSD